jgi:hypothetical protein
MMNRLLMLAILAACGCSSVRVDKLAPIDQSDKSMTVPIGGSGLTGKIKRELAKDGWRIAASHGPIVTDVSPTRRQTYDTFRTRYKLIVYEQQYDWQLPDLDPMYIHDLSVIDTRTGNEVLLVSGQHAGKVIAKRFVEALRY